MIISVINNKGGTGKTTTCVNLCAALSLRGYSALLIDLDSQASASISLGYNQNDNHPSIADVLFEDLPINSAVQNTSIENFDIITGSMELANSDLIFADTPDREEILLNCFNKIKNNYDFIICDCPPSLSTIFINSLVASDSYIVPITPEYLALEGFANLMKVIAKLKENMDFDINLMGILFTMVNPRFTKNRKIAKDILDLINSEYGDLVFKTKIIRSIMLSEAPVNSTSIFEYAPHSAGAQQYLSLTDEIILRSQNVIDS